MRIRRKGEGSVPSTQLVVGPVIIALSSVALFGVFRGQGQFFGGTTPSGFWWGLLALLGGCLSLGLVWTVIGIQGCLPPTSFIYRMTDLPGLWDRLTRSR